MRWFVAGFVASLACIAGGVALVWGEIKRLVR